MVKIVKPEIKDLENCFELEKYYTITKDTKEDIGFFLPGTLFNVYKSLFEDGYMRVIKDSDLIVAFVIVIPPGHNILKNMLTSESIRFFDGKFCNYKKSYWIAKVAVHPNYVKKGYASELYSTLEIDFKGYTALIATAFSPLRNFPSEKLQESFGMKQCGEFVSKKHDKTYISTVWKK